MKKPKLFQWTLTGNAGTRVVTAATEAEARHKAMVERWGPPTGIYGPTYRGVGLEIVRQEPT